MHGLPLRSCMPAGAANAPCSPDGRQGQGSLPGVGIPTHAHKHWRAARPAAHSLRFRPRLRHAASAAPKDRPVAFVLGEGGPEALRTQPPHRLPALHGDVRTTHYGWMRDLTRSKVPIMLHMKQENDHARLMLRAGTAASKAGPPGGKPPTIKALQGEVERAVWEAAMHQAALQDDHAGDRGWDGDGDGEGGGDGDGGWDGLQSVPGREGGVAGPDSLGKQYVYFTRQCPPAALLPIASSFPSATEPGAGRMGVAAGAGEDAVQHCWVELEAWQQATSRLIADLVASSAGSTSTSTNTNTSTSRTGIREAGRRIEDIVAALDPALVTVIVDESSRHAALFAQSGSVPLFSNSNGTDTNTNGGCTSTSTSRSTISGRGGGGGGSCTEPGGRPGASPGRVVGQYRLHSLQLSPDASMVAFTDGLVLSDLDGGGGGMDGPDGPAGDRLPVDQGDEEAAGASAPALYGSASSGTGSAVRVPAVRHGHLTLHVWEACSGRPVAVPVPHVQGPLAWSPDSGTLHFIASGGAQLWSLPIFEKGEADGGGAGVSSGLDTCVDEPSRPLVQPAAQVGGSAPMLVFEDPEWLCIAFRRVGGCLTAQALGSDMVAAQVLLLLPVGEGEAPPDLLDPADLPDPTDPMDPADLAYASDLREQRQRSVGSMGPGRHGWRWRNLMPRTLGSHMEIHPCSLPGRHAPARSRSASDHSDNSNQDPDQAAATVPNIACEEALNLQLVPGEQLRNKAPRTELGASHPGSGTVPRAAALLVRHWDAGQPWGRLLLLPLAAELAEASGLGAVAGERSQMAVVGAAPTTAGHEGAAGMADQERGIQEAGWVLPARAWSSPLWSGPLLLCSGLIEVLPAALASGWRLVDIQVSAAGRKILVVRERMKPEAMAVMLAVADSLAAASLPPSVVQLLQMGEADLDAHVVHTEGGFEDGRLVAETYSSSSSSSPLSSNSSASASSLPPSSSSCSSAASLTSSRELSKDHCEYDARVYRLVMRHGCGSRSDTGQSQQYGLELLTSRAVVFPFPFINIQAVCWRRDQLACQTGEAPVGAPSATHSPATDLGRAADAGRTPTASGSVADSPPYAYAGAVHIQYSLLGMPSSSLVLELNGRQGGEGVDSVDSHPFLVRPPRRASRAGGAQYTHRQLWAPSTDGIQVLISLTYRIDATAAAAAAGRRKAGPGTAWDLPRGVPVLLQVYGAFGLPDSLDYQAGRVPLLDRGWVLAVAHVRGGGHLGPAWHEAGRRGFKAAGSADLLACVEHLVATGVAHPARITLEAASAGAWAAVPALLANETRGSGSCFAGAVLTVPSLDPLSEMIRNRYGWHELGCPLDAATYHTVKKWNPLDLLSASMCSTAPKPDTHWTSPAGGAQAPLPPGACSHSGPLLAGGGQRRTQAAEACETRAESEAWTAPVLRLLLRSGLFDDRVGFWEQSIFVAALRHQQGRSKDSNSDSDSSSSDNSSTPGAAFHRPIHVALRVKAGGHGSFDTAADDAELCSFLLASVVSDTQLKL